jgi:hypothetical protein
LLLVSFRVNSWIVLLAGLEQPIHEATRTNTKRARQSLPTPNASATRLM